MQQTLINDTETDTESLEHLERMREAEAIKANRLPGIKTVLVALSSSGMVFDIEALRQKIHYTYPEAQVFFLTTAGKPVGPKHPAQVDLLIDLNGPGSRCPFLLPRKLRSVCRVTIGRDAGLWRANVYDKLYDEKADSALPRERLARERYVQKKVLALAGVPLVPTGDTHPDRGKSIALSLPPMARL